jgi:hypothetical protein
VTDRSRTGDSSDDDWNRAWHDRDTLGVAGAARSLCVARASVATIFFINGAATANWPMLAPPRSNVGSDLAA